MYDLNNTVLLAKVVEDETTALDILASEPDVNIVLLDPAGASTTFLYTRFAEVEMPTNVESLCGLSTGRGNPVVSRFEVDAAALFDIASNHDIDLIDDYRFGCEDLFCFAEEMEAVAIESDVDHWADVAGEEGYYEEMQARAANMQNFVDTATTLAEPAREDGQMQFNLTFWLALLSTIEDAEAAWKQLVARERLNEGHWITPNLRVATPVEEANGYRFGRDGRISRKWAFAVEEYAFA